MIIIFLDETECELIVNQEVIYEEEKKNKGRISEQQL